MSSLGSIPPDDGDLGFDAVGVGAVVLGVAFGLVWAAWLLS